MTGLIAAGLIGALGGAGKGISTVGEIAYKDQLDQHRIAANEDMAARAEDRRLANQRTLAADEHVYQDARAKVSNELQSAQTDKLRAEIAKEKEIGVLRTQLAKTESLAANDPAAKQLADAMRAKLNVMTGEKSGQTYSIRTEEDPDTGDTKNVTEIKGKGTPPKPKDATRSSAVSGLPAGAVKIGTSGGKPVYRTPDGKQLIGE